MNILQMFLFSVSVVLLNFVSQTKSTAVENGPKKSLLSSSIFVDDIVVESTLNVRPKVGPRQGRARQFELQPKSQGPSTAARVDGSQILNLKRNKRQNFNRFPSFQQYPQNFGQGFQPFKPPKFSASSAQAQAQGFQNQGPLGGFGAAAAGAGSQGFSFDESGFRGNAGMSGSQSYNLPNGQTLAISYTGGFNVGPDGKPTVSKGNSIAFSGPNGRPATGFNPNANYNDYDS